MVLQRPDRFDEPAVVRPAADGGLDRAEIAAAMLLCEFGGHPLTVLLACAGRRYRVSPSTPWASRDERVGDLRRRQAAGTLV